MPTLVGLSGARPPHDRSTPHISLGASRLHRAWATVSFLDASHRSAPRLWRSLVGNGRQGASKPHPSAGATSLLPWVSFRWPDHGQGADCRHESNT
eukprot:scaffold83324_cov34-Tisochrysis_lutea.AAC.2